MLLKKARIVLLSPVSIVAYLSICCQLCQEVIYIFQSIALLKSLQHNVDLVCVIGGCQAQCQLCQLSRSERWQRISLQKAIDRKSNNCKTIGQTFQCGRRKVQSQSARTLEKLELRACKSCKVAKPEKLPRFACSHSMLPPLNETQPGSAKKTETKPLAGFYHHMLSRLDQNQAEGLLLPDESFFERNGLMKWVRTACWLSLSMDAVWPLNALMLKFERRGFNIKTTRTLQVPLKWCLQWRNISNIRLHSLVREAAEVVGAKAE